MSNYKNYTSILKADGKAVVTITPAKPTKTIKQWEVHFDTLVMDYDGFPKDTNIYETLFTEQEFLENTRTSTVLFSEKLVEALKNISDYQTPKRGYSCDF